MLQKWEHLLAFKDVQEGTGQYYVPVLMHLNVNYAIQID